MVCARSCVCARLCVEATVAAGNVQVAAEKLLFLTRVEGEGIRPFTGVRECVRLILCF